MNKRYWLALSAASIAVCAGVAFAQHPILDQAAQKVIQKYQTSTCEQLWESRGKQTPEQQKVIGFLRSDPSMRTEFINIIAAPVANKMFECGMIP
jgi:replication initiation and membrane attachment protein DnaB